MDDKTSYAADVETIVGRLNRITPGEEIRAHAHLDWLDLRVFPRWRLIDSVLDRLATPAYKIDDWASETVDAHPLTQSDKFEAFTTIKISTVAGLVRGSVCFYTGTASKSDFDKVAARVASLIPTLSSGVTLGGRS